MTSISSFSPPPLTTSSSSATQQRRSCVRRSFRGGACVSLSSVTVSCLTKEPKVVVTRERGKNGKLINALVLNRLFAGSSILSFNWMCMLFSRRSRVSVVVSWWFSARE